MIFLGPYPRDLGTISVPKFLRVVRFKAIRSCLEGSCYEKILSLDQIFWMDLLDKNLGRDQREPDFFEHILQILHGFLTNVLGLNFVLYLISVIKSSVASSPSEAR